jgi:hypothetical protein
MSKEVVAIRIIATVVLRELSTLLVLFCHHFIYWFEVQSLTAEIVTL